MTKVKVPRWVTEPEECTWCHRESMKVTEITVIKEKWEEGLLIHYACDYELCRHKKTYKKKHVMPIKYSGNGYVKRYSKFKEELKKKPSEEVPKVVESGC